MQGTSMEGPIPSTISLLRNLTELRISDLSGSSSSFPDLQDLNLLKILILRNCLISDEIPSYIGDLTSLKTLDLSFNKITGQIPQTMQSITKNLDFVFFTNNSLTGEVPDWIMNTQNKFDLSYNNFTRSSQLSCSSLSVNLVSSYSSSEGQSWCLKKDLPCSGKPQHHSLFINCGGTKLEHDGNEYEEDLTDGGAAHFVSSAEKWAYSSTGVYMGKSDAPYRATFANETKPQFYQSARLSPLSLKYYGLCLREGSYKVQLHFAEIMYSDNQTFTSLGRRIFDVSIQ
ncbi:probable LRR receptor-like serine/threonine-protein kinase At1g53440, partial [Morus notabilis]